MKYFRAVAERKRALADCVIARRDLHAAGANLGETYRAFPLPALAAVAGVGFVLSKLRAGSKLVVASVRLASGPTVGLIRSFLNLA